MTRFNNYDPIVSPASVDQGTSECSENDRQSVDSPPILEEDIDLLNYSRGIRLLRRNNIVTGGMKTIEDIKEFLRLRYFTKREDTENFIDEIQRQIEHGRKNQAMLLEIADEMRKVFVEKTKGEAYAKIEEHLEAGFYTNWRANLESWRKKLSCRETAILIAGETGAGKSSLINLLLGCKILPHTEHPCTAAICTIKNSERKCVRLHRRRKTEEELMAESEDTNNQEVNEIDFDDEKTWWDFIMNRSLDHYRWAEILCPIPLLKNSSGAFFVDSPGFREEEALSKVLYDYLPKASAFVIMLMTDNEKGFNQTVETFLGNVMKNIKDASVNNEESSVMMRSRSNISADNVIFVFNRWDKVVDEMDSAAAAHIRRMCLERLRMLWTENIIEGKNVFFLSVSKINFMMQQGACAPDEYLKFQKALFSLIPKSIEILVESAYEWMQSLTFLGFMKTTREKLGNTYKNKDVKDREAESLKLSLKALQESFNTTLSDVNKIISEEKKQFVKELLAHLKSDEAMQRMTGIHNDLENYNEPPEWLDCNVEKMEHVIGILHTFTEKRIKLEISFWNRREAYGSNPETGCLELLNERTRFAKFVENIKAICRERFSKFETPKSRHVLTGILDTANILSEGTSSSMKGSNIISRDMEKIFFGVTAIIWLPILVVGGAFILPFIATYLMNERMDSKRSLEEFNKNREASAISFLEQFLKEKLDEKIVTPFLSEPFSKTDAIHYEIKNYMDKVTSVTECEIRDLTQQWDSITNERKAYNSVLDDCKKVARLLYQFYAPEMKTYEYSENDFEFKCKSSETLTADIYDDYSRSLEKRVVIKLLRDPITRDNALDIFSEESAWRKLCRSHPKNVVDFYGMLKLKSENGEGCRIGFVMEKCDMTLEQFMACSLDYVPHKQTTLEMHDLAFQKMVKIVDQISMALYYVHANGYVHRDLRSENIQVLFGDTEVIVKLCDFQWSKSQKDINNSMTKQNSMFPFPELSNGEGTSSATDIFSLGLLLWELYHGTKVTDCVDETKLRTLQNQESLIPFEDGCDARMPSGFLELMQQCLHFKTTRRPSIVYVTKILSKL